jgi:hypothetical protein
MKSHYFQPEPLASRAPGLAATRGTFQAGLFAEGCEVGLTTLEEAIEFIRRGYNSHGSEPFPGVPVTRGGRSISAVPVLSSSSATRNGVRLAGVKTGWTLDRH